MRILSVILLVFMSHCAMAQRLMLSMLKDSLSQAPIANATISISRAPNGQQFLYVTKSGEDGRFNIRLNDIGQVLVTITHTSYKRLIIPVQDSLPATIFLSPAVSSLAGVTVTVSKPLIEKNDDKLIYNVEADASMDGQSANDALRKTPFVSVDGEGNVFLKGQGNFKILLNGRETAMFTKEPAEALRAFPASIIRRIEVITNPSAKYDAEGVGGIINIVTKKKVMGYNMTIAGSINSLNTYNGNITTNIKQGKLGVASYISASDYRKPANGVKTVTEALQPGVYAKRILEGEWLPRSERRFGELELSYDIDSLNTFSSYMNFLNNKGRNYNTKQAYSISPGYTDTITGLLYDTSTVENPTTSIGLDYIRKFKRNAQQEWTAKFNHETSRDVSLVNSDELYAGYGRFIINNNRARNRQTTIQSDLLIPFTKNRRLEVGAKLILRKAFVDYEGFYSHDPASGFTPDAGNTDHFNYHQEVYGVYATYGFKISDWMFRTGSRIEHTDVRGNFVHAAAVVRQRYSNFFPSLYISKKLSKRQDISFSYSKRLRRPYILDLNPFVSNTDSLNIRRGNEYLDPELTHSFEIGYSYFKGSTSISLVLSENYCNNQIIRYSFFDAATGVTQMFPDNIGINLYTGANGNIAVKLFNVWSLGLNTGVQYNSIKNSRNKAQKNTGISGYANFSTSVDLGKQFTGYSTFAWQQSPILLQGRFVGYISYTSSLAWKTAGNKLRFTITASNFLAPDLNYKNTFSDIGFIRTTYSRYPSRSIGLSARWNFGKLADNVSRKRGIKNDDLLSN